jgi:hypothetical protein
VQPQNHTPAIYGDVARSIAVYPDDKLRSEVLDLAVGQRDRDSAGRRWSVDAQVKATVPQAEFIAVTRSFLAPGRIRPSCYLDPTRALSAAVDQQDRCKQRPAGNGEPESESPAAR